MIFILRLLSPLRRFICCAILCANRSGTVSFRLLVTAFYFNSAYAGPRVFAHHREGEVAFGMESSADSFHSRVGNIDCRSNLLLCQISIVVQSANTSYLSIFYHIKGLLLIHSEVPRYNNHVEIYILIDLFWRLV